VSQTPASPGWGDAVTYQLVVTNTGSATLTGVTVADTLSPVVTVVTPATPPGFTLRPVGQAASGTLYSWVSSSPLPPGAGATFTLTGIVGAVCAPDAVSNTGFVSAVSACSTTAMSAATPPFLVVAPPFTLAVSAVKKQVPSATLFAAGEPLTYMIVVQNTGDTTITALTVVDTVSALVVNVTTDQPAGFVAPVVIPAPAGPRYVWSGIGLAFRPGDVFTFTITGKAAATTVASPVTNTACAIFTNGCSVQGVLTNGVSMIVEAVPPGPDPLLLDGPGAALDRNVIRPPLGEIVLVRLYPFNSDPITVRVFTASARLVRTLRHLVPIGSGQFLVTWDGKTEDEFPVARGVYLVHVSGGGITALLKVVVK
jgi:uncharacterized repeat protein (TIGR01451 family)